MLLIENVGEYEVACVQSGLGPEHKLDYAACVRPTSSSRSNLYSGLEMGIHSLGGAQFV